MTILIKHQTGSGSVHDDALYIRKTVFVEEQGVPLSEELDDLGNAMQFQYLVAYINNKPATTARVIEEESGVWHIQRVATLPEMRHRSLGRQMMRYIEELSPTYHIHTLRLGAQLQAENFYRQLDFTPYGSSFLEAGIMHINMKKELN
ncbi:GNAT family N-acetyltransferase [Leuconostoc palmae]|uniref:GNAT family N-acetyltransferase n=1 Tax=Leuconostoc palmae TaxID=501487 RepID=UPI001C7DEC02|nr:GNAT family N-acetyltransferase [Leuconostoc palmae]